MTIRFFIWSEYSQLSSSLLRNSASINMLILKFTPRVYSEGDQPDNLIAPKSRTFHMTDFYLHDQHILFVDRYLF